MNKAQAAKLIQTLSNLQTMVLLPLPVDFYEDPSYELDINKIGWIYAVEREGEGEWVVKWQCDLHPVEASTHYKTFYQILESIEGLWIRESDRGNYEGDPAYIIVDLDKSQHLRDSF